MERVLASLSVTRAREVLRGVPLKVTLLDDDQVETLVSLSLHCMLNGPVGVNKVTTFPIVGDGSIKSLLGVDISNGQWRATVQPIAEYIIRSADWADVVADSQFVRHKHTIWPLNEVSA